MGIYLRISCFLLLVLVQSLPMQAQILFTGHSYCPGEAAQQAPSLMAFTRLKTEVTITGFQTSLYTNGFYVNVPAYNMVLTPRTEIKALADMHALSPGFFINPAKWGRPRQGLYIGMSAHSYASVTGISGLTDKLLNGPASDPDYLTLGVKKGNAMVYLHTINIDVAYAHEITNSSLRSVSLGYQAGLLMPFGYASFSEAGSQYTETRGKVHNYSYNMVPESPLNLTKKGTGIRTGFSVTFIRKRRVRHSGQRCPAVRTRMYIPVNYERTFTAGISELGVASFNRSEARSGTVYFDTTFRFSKLRDNETIADKNITAVLPATFYAIYDHHLRMGYFVKAGLTLPLTGGTLLQTPARLWVAPRIETPYFEAGLIGSLTEWTSPGIGAFIRIYGISAMLQTQNRNGLTNINGLMASLAVRIPITRHLY